MVNFDLFKVGGYVRDKIMGRKSKDIDYVAVVKEGTSLPISNVEYVFSFLQLELQAAGYHIWLVTPDCFTIRARFPNQHEFAGMTADFVLARKEVGYIPGTRKPILELGTLHDDLTRRDFTINAIAESEDGKLIDPFGGVEDIQERILMTPLPCQETFSDDPLRILRAIRFAITKQFKLSHDITYVISNFAYYQKMNVVSWERIREELFKCFSYNTMETLRILRRFPTLEEYCFTDSDLYLKPTLRS